MNLKEITENIFYSPATNGKSEESISNGMKLIESYAKEKAWEAWKYLDDFLSFHLSKGTDKFCENDSRTDFEQWWEENK